MAFQGCSVLHSCGKCAYLGQVIERVLVNYLLIVFDIYLREDYISAMDYPTPKDLLTYKTLGKFLMLADMSNWGHLTSSDIVARMVEVAREHRDAQRQLEAA